MKLDQLYRAWN